jgi:hypothetical protein
MALKSARWPPDWIKCPLLGELLPDEGTALDTLSALSCQLGFLTVVHEPAGYVGGYLVTNQWGRPLEFRLSSAVQPNRVQQILYAGTLETYLCAELIGKTLVEKTGVPVQLVVTDTAAVLALREHISVPVVWVAPAEAPATWPLLAGQRQPPLLVRERLYCHPAFAEDASFVQELLARRSGLLDLAEPFGRIREALAEARKLGAARAA